MSDFGKTILNRLLDKYENSVLSKGGGERKIAISLSLKDKELSTYRAADSYNYRDRNDAVLGDYAARGFITVKRDKSGDFESLTLRTENVGLIYAYLKRSDPAKELEEVKQILFAENADGVIGDFVSFCKERIAKNYSFPKIYFDSPAQLRDILSGLREIEKLDKETKFRDFSVNVYGDSKKFESLKTKIARVYVDFDKECSVDCLNEETVPNILEEKNLVRNTTYAIMKGRISFELNGVRIDLGKFGYEFCLSDEMIKNLKFLNLQDEKVVTIENLTSFYDFRESGYIALYLGGFHNHTKRMLINKIHESYPSVRFFHFGDIDVGGIYILKHLRNKTGIDFVPYKMDVNTLAENKGKWKKLTENDVVRLEKISDSDFAELKNYMLENYCKLEQEAISEL